MRRLDRPQDRMQGVVTYELDDGRFVQFDARTVADVGIDELMRHAGIEPPTGRLPVYQRGKKVGTVPASFEPMAIKNTSFFYEPRGGDFIRTDDGWEACHTICPGDFDAIPGFVWDRG